MNLVASALAAAGVIAVAGALAGVAVPPRWRAAIAGGLTGLCGLAGAAAGLAAVTGTLWRLEVPWLLPLSGLAFAVDALSGWFLLVIGAVTAVVGVYTIGYAGRDGHGPGSRTALAVLPLFAASMLAVPAAGSVATLLFGWELMALVSLLLVLTEHRHQVEVRAAAVWYAAMTQAGFLSLLLGLLWLATAAGDGRFEALRRAAAGQPPALLGAVFLLCLAGFASKAGAVPLHPWLPRAHAEAPSHVSALMSAGMVNLGVYGILRVGFDLLGGGAAWWWLVTAVLGALSALYGIMQAAVARDLKRLLAFSTSENTGLILLGIGFAGMLAAGAGSGASTGGATVAGLALVAALLHTATHAGFKTLLFAGAGSVVRATGTRDLDRLGGLGRTMPATTAFVVAGSLAAAALPPGPGFISEWLLLQALLHPGAEAGTAIVIMAPLAVVVVALTAGLAVATFVKVVGTGFLARPRSEAAAAGRESPRPMLVAMGLAAAACLALSAVPALVVRPLGRIVAALGLGPAPVTGDALRLGLVGIEGQLWPLWLALAIPAGAGAVALVARGLGRARRQRIPWDCGDGPLTARMEYTATSFAEPLQRVFDDVLAPEQDLDVTHESESAYYPAAIRYRQRVPDRIENRLYGPLIAVVARAGEASRALANGSVHRYLAYMLVALLAVLGTATVIR